MPYAPGVVDRSGEIMAQGISGATSNIADTIDKYTQLSRQTKAYRQMAVDGMGMDPDEVDKMSFPQLQGKMKGAAIKSAQAEHAAKIQDLMGQAKERESIGAYRQSMADRAVLDQSNMDGYNRNVGQATAPSQAMTAADMMGRNPAMGASPMGMAMGMNSAIQQPTVSPQMTPELAAQLMSRSNLNPEQMLKVSQAYKMMGVPGMGGAGNPAPTFTEDPVSGARFVTAGKQLIPSGMNPKSVGKAIDVHDDAGNVLGQGTVDPKTGKLTMVKNTKVSGLLQPVIDPNTKQPLPGFGMDATGKVHDFRSTLEKTMGTGAPGAAASAAQPATPSTQAEYDKLPKGALYYDQTGATKRKK